MYVNVALRDPLNPPPATQYESGGATDNVLSLWKAAAPAIDILAPDIYLPEPRRYLKVLELYGRPDNPLFVPETIGSPTVSRFCYAALARGAIGWSPFGIDGAMQEGRVDPASPTSDALHAMYRAIRPNMRAIARLGFEGRLHAAWEVKGATASSIPLGRWLARVTFGPRTFGFGRITMGNAEPVGRALVGRLGPDEFLVTVYLCRVDFEPADAGSGAQRQYLRVEEGGYAGAVFRPIRIWNGDETDWGLNFGREPQMLRVRLGTY